MHRLPRFFIRSEKRKDMEARNKGKRFERLYARKDINYEPTSSSSDGSSTFRTRSFDLPPLGDRTSFRIEGNEGELDEIYRILGLSGPEDFAIPEAAWESRKIRSSSDLLPRSRLQQLESPKADTPSLQEVSRFAGSTGCQIESANGVVGGVYLCKLSDRLEETVATGDVNNDLDDASELIGFPLMPASLRCGGGGGGGGIKGVRPPSLAPPPAMSLPVMDNACSTWDLLRSFAPDAAKGSSSLRELCSDDDEEGYEEITKQKEVNDMRLGERVVLSESCSFTTSNDDDSSSATTEPMSNISPNGRFGRIITYWQKGDLLGRGSFGSVYEGISDDGFFFAIKEVSLLDQGELGRQSIHQLEQEILLLRQFEHENIVQYYGTDKDESNLYIFLELVSKGSLLSLYQKYDLRDSQVSAYTRQILHGLKYLHARNVVHRDIKCANLLVDANGSVKLADFGLAKATKLNDVKSCKGTAFWMAPEVVRNQGYGLAADIWSLGCTVLEMLTRQFPYSPLEYMQALFRIGKGVPPPVPESLSQDAHDFIRKCLHIKPDARPTASQLLDHPFVRRPLPASSGSASPLHPSLQVIHRF